MPGYLELCHPVSRLAGHMAEHHPRRRDCGATTHDIVAELATAGAGWDNAASFVMTHDWGNSDCFGGECTPSVCSGNYGVRHRPLGGQNYETFLPASCFGVHPAGDSPTVQIRTRIRIRSNCIGPFCPPGHFYGPWGPVTYTSYEPPATPSGPACEPMDPFRNSERIPTAGYPITVTFQTLESPEDCAVQPWDLYRIQVRRAGLDPSTNRPWPWSGKAIAECRSGNFGVHCQANVFVVHNFRFGLISNALGEIRIWYDKDGNPNTG